MQSDDEGGDPLRLFLAHRSRLEAVIYRRVGCHATASDLVQDLFLRMFGRPVAPIGGALGYFLRSARNLAIDHVRAQRRHAALLEDVYPAHQPPALPLPEADAAGRQDLARVAAVLRALPDRPRRAFLLHKVHGRSYPEIARALGVSLSTIEKDMQRTLAACRAALADPQPQPQPPPAASDR